ncbi:MAG TPA: DUF58 domain-containing protein [Planctomycetota bacterium]|nr:DUF58 domain-containing protein [Planctomycetota bacterium]
MAERAGPGPGRRLLDPQILNKIGRLELRARLLVEGFLAGLHRSPYKGVSVDFREHREYVPGDDPRFLDWKVFAKSDRFVVKEYEEETNLACHLFLDTSESMAFASERLPKFEYARTVAASLAYLCLRQRDAVGLSLYDEGISRTLQAATGDGQLRELLRALEAAAPKRKTATGRVLRETGERLRRRGIVVVVSDLLDDPDEVLAGLRGLRQRGHEVLVFQILDPSEVRFPYERMTLFEGMEEGPRLLVDPRALREAYLAEVRAFLDRIRAGCLSHRIDWVLATTDTPLDVVLVAYLGKRARAARGRRTA